MLLGKSIGQLLKTPERMKRLDESRNDAQLWMRLGVKVKSKAGKNNIAQLSTEELMLLNCGAGEDS